MTRALYPPIHGDQHLPHGSDPIPGLDQIPDPSGTDLSDIILSVGPDAFWKLNEASGIVAHDSSGNAHDLTADTGAGFTAPTWGNAAGPPGEPTAGWTGTGLERVFGSLSAFTDNFTAAVWVKMGDTLYNGELIGQAQAYHSGTGWALAAHAIGGGNKFSLALGGIVVIDANNPYTAGTWYFVAIVRDGGTWKLYVNGLLQAVTSTTSPGSFTGGNTWLGNDAYSGHGSYLHVALLSYAFIASSVLTSTQLVAMYDSGVSGGALAGGLVWTSDGAGGASWQPATIEVDY